MPSIYNIKQYILSNGGIASCHSELKNGGVMHVCEIYDHYATRTYSGRVTESYLYENVINQNLRNIYGQEHQVKVINA